MCRNKVKDIDTVRVYHILQWVWFAVMATLIMRLKVFLTPQLALLSSLVVNKVQIHTHTHQCLEPITCIRDFLLRISV